MASLQLFLMYRTQQEPWAILLGAMVPSQRRGEAFHPSSQVNTDQRRGSPAGWVQSSKSNDTSSFLGEDRTADALPEKHRLTSVCHRVGSVRTKPKTLPWPFW